MDYNDNINKDISNYAFVQFIKPETFIADSKKKVQRIYRNRTLNS